jgi:protein TonB
MQAALLTLRAQEMPGRTPLPFATPHPGAPPDGAFAMARSSVPEKVAPVHEALPIESAAVTSGQSASARSAPSSAAEAPLPTRTAADPEGVNADELRQYRLELAIAARRFKRYPELARERGWEGRVEVAVSVRARLPVPQFSLVGSSGHAVLDEQALWMLEQASAATMLPGGLRSRDFRIVLPLEFTLEEDR